LLKFVDKCDNNAVIAFEGNVIFELKFALVELGHFYVENAMGYLRFFPNHYADRV